GLHQAVEAKEGVTIQKENQTLASITFQNYFRMYHKLAGMTGTADTEAYEFQEIYSLETVVIPTHRPMVRQDRMDQVYRTMHEKYQAVINDIKDCYDRAQPVLVGTTSIETSEYLSNLLAKEKVPHQVLNAKQHAREAEVVTQAGQPRMVTLATNMAGRGTDIVLGGNIEPEIEKINGDEALSTTDRAARIDALREEWRQRHDQVLTSGGLHIIGTERHESRRVDNQLRGRAGRQGDAGSSRFYLSLEDSLLRIFASDRVASIMERLKMPEGEAIEHPWVTRAIENAQRKVEARNFDIRKQLLEYDDVSNDQRKVIYQQRNELLEEEDIAETINAMRGGVINDAVSQHIRPESMEEEWDVAGLEKTLSAEYQLQLPVQEWLNDDKALHEEDLRRRIADAAEAAYAHKEEQAGPEVIRQFERAIMLQSLDTHWREHLAALDHLRQGIHLRGYAQQDPKQAYKQESFELFASMLETIKREVIQVTMTVQVHGEEDLNFMEEPAGLENLQYLHAEFGEEAETALAEEEDAHQPYVRQGEKVGRNDPCPCGSGKKYKQCHGKL
ncbi:MAG TPA: preprotein translocase subunit SecA, partial [Betaproteobacteria bacterium]|nr:preprotein translocase subunit SecA [Betaproteobacteria bacterium]